jgi:hypothetical protein
MGIPTASEIILIIHLTSAMPSGMMNKWADWAEWSR